MLLPPFLNAGAMRSSICIEHNLWLGYRMIGASSHTLFIPTKPSADSYPHRTILWYGPWSLEVIPSCQCGDTGWNRKYIKMSREIPWQDCWSVSKLARSYGEHNSSKSADWPGEKERPRCISTDSSVLGYFWEAHSTLTPFSIMGMAWFDILGQVYESMKVEPTLARINRRSWGY